MCRTCCINTLYEICSMNVWACCINWMCVILMCWMCVILISCCIILTLYFFNFLFSVFKTIIYLLKTFGFLEKLLPYIGGRISKLLQCFKGLFIGQYGLSVMFGYIDLLIRNWMVLMDGNVTLCSYLGLMLIVCLYHIGYNYCCLGIHSA